MDKALYKIVDVESIKNNKFYFICKIILSCIFSITITLDTLLVFNGSIDGGINDIYFNKFEIQHILIFLGIAILTYLIISLLEITINKIEQTIYIKKERKERNIKVYFIILGIILIFWLPTILTYFPGGIYADTVDSIRQAIGITRWNNKNPLLYAIIIKIFTSVGNLQLGMELFTVFQILIMAVAISYSIYWLYKKGISTKYIVLATTFFCICRLIPIYAVSIWKDTPFCIALYTFIIFLAEIVYQDGKNLEKIRNVIIYSALLVLICFLRNNGIYIGFAVTLIVLLMYRKSVLNKLKIFSLTSVILIVLIYIIQGVIYTKLNMQTGIIEKLGVPVQQLCYVVANEGNITEHQLQFIEKIYPIEKIKENYNPCIVDKVKWAEGFSNKYIDENKIQFFKVWGKVFLQNPSSFIKAYLLNTIGFWDVNKATMDAYINPQMWKDRKEIIIDKNNIVKQTDYIEKLTGYSIKSIITPNMPVSSAVFLFISLFSALITIYKKRYKNLLIYLPALLTWATIMIAVPLAFSLRYVYILVMITPISLLVPFFKTKEENTEKGEIKKLISGDKNK